MKWYRRRIVFYGVIIPTLIVGVATLDFLGPWYLPLFLFVVLGAARAVGVPSRFWMVFVWPLYASVVTGLWVSYNNMEFVRSVSAMFSLPWPSLLWVIPCLIFTTLGSLSFFIGRQLGILVYRPYAR